MDGMQASLNKEIQSSVFPNWRNHASIKGKTKIQGTTYELLRRSSFTI